MPGTVAQALATVALRMVPTCAAVTPDGRHVLLGSANGAVLLYDNDGTEKLKLVRALRGLTETLQTATFSPDGKTIISSSISPDDAQATQRQWNAASGALIASTGKPLEFEESSTLSPDGALRVTTVRGSKAGANAELRDAKTSAKVRQLKQSVGAALFRFINGGKSIIGRFGGKSLRVWDTATGEAEFSAAVHDRQISAIAVSPDGALLATGDLGGGLIIWNARRAQPKRLHSLEIQPTNPVLSLRFSPDGGSLAVAMFGQVLLCDARNGTLGHALSGNGGAVPSVAFSPDGTRVLTAGNGTVKLWNLNSGSLVATFYAFPVQVGAPPEYLVVTPAGYYAGSAAADRYVRFRLVDTLYPAESFQAKYYRPDLVQKALAGERLPPVGGYKGPFPPVAKIGLAPIEQAVTDSVRVLLSATDDSEIKNIAFFVNGARVDARPLLADSRPLTAEARALVADARGIVAEARGLTADARPLVAESRAVPEAHKVLRRFTAELPVPAGTSQVRVQAIAFDDDGLQSAREEVVFTREAAAAPAGRLLALCVGVSQYQDARLNLRFADADATALAAALRAQRGIYSAAEATTLVNEQATAAAIVKALDGLVQNCTRGDTVMLSLAGHGWRDDDRNFYFAAHGVNRNDVSRTALPWRAITERLTQLSQKSRRVIVFLDACHSGSAATNEELVKATLATNAGVLIFASSRGAEVSLENADWGHGAFTKALLEGIEGKAAQDEGRVTMLELIAYVARRVKSLTQDQQHPHVPFLQDFDTDTALLHKTN